MSNYEVSDLTVLTPREHVRLRRGMYIGDAADPSPLFNEIFDNAIDECQAGYSNKVEIRVDYDQNSYSIIDYGRGFPQGKIHDPSSGKDLEALEMLCTTSFSGGKFNHSAYKLSTGLHGLGMLVTNSLSSTFEVKTWRNHTSVVRYLAHYGETSDTDYLREEYGVGASESGTCVYFIPDPEMFNETKIPLSHILMRCRVASAFGMKSDLTVVESGEEKVIDTTSDIYDLLPPSDEGVSEYYRHSFTVKDQETGEFATIALQYTSDTKSYYRGYTNLLYNSQGGTHHKMLDDAIYEAWSKFNIKGIKWSDIYLGLRAVVAVFISHTEFSSQSKERLSVDKSSMDNLKVLIVDEIVKWLTENEEIRESLIKRFQEYRDSQNKLLARKEIKSLLYVNENKGGQVRRVSVVRKLRECNSKTREGTELGICLSGDTRIRLLSGTSKTIKELAESDCDEWLYGVDREGNFIPVRGYNFRKTRTVKELVKLTLSDGTVIKCTPDHRFLRRDESQIKWARSEDLKEGDSLFHLSFCKDKEGYEEVADISGEYQYTHRLVCDLLKKDEVEELRSHWQETHKQGDRPVIHPEVKAKYAELLANRNKDEDLKLKQVKGKIGKVLSEILFRGLEISEDNYEKVRVEVNKSTPKWWKVLDIFKTLDSVKEFAKTYNYKIVKVETISEETDVYTCTVDHEFRAYALENGIITHNCEGDSALGAFIQARDPATQAILPTRGKILNVSRLGDLNDALKNEEIRSIVNSIGAGIGEMVDSEKSRYDKIIFYTDADLDGLNIRALLISIFVNLLAGLVIAGRVYIALPPLYGWKDKKGNYHFANTIKEIPESVKDFNRYKGLGEMDPDELWESCMNPETRRLIRVNYPENLGEFNSIMTSSSVKYQLLVDMGIVRDGE